MSQTLGQKLSTLLSAKMHDIVNRALQGNPILVLKDVLRQYYEADAELETSLGLALGSVKSEERHVREQQAIVDNITADIERIYTDDDKSNDSQAENKGLNLVGQKDVLATKKQTYQAAVNTYEGLRKAKNLMERRIISLENQIDLLEAIQTEADMKRLTADILIRSANLVSNNIASVESMAETIKKNRDQEDARLEMALGKMEAASTDTDLEGRADDELAKIRARLGVDNNASQPAQSSSLDMMPEDLQQLAAAS